MVVVSSKCTPAFGTIWNDFFIAATWGERSQFLYDVLFVKEDLEHEYEEQFVPHNIEAEGRDRREKMMNFITPLNR